MNIACYGNNWIIWLRYTYIFFCELSNHENVHEFSSYDDFRELSHIDYWYKNFKQKTQIWNNTLELIVFFLEIILLGVVCVVVCKLASKYE